MAAAVAAAAELGEREGAVEDRENASEKSAVHTVQMGVDDEVVDEEEEEEEEDPAAEMFSCLPSAVGSAAAWLWRWPLISVGAAAGVVLVAVGLELQSGESSRTTSLALLLVGWWLVAGLVSVGVVDVSTWLLSTLLKLTSWWHLREWCSAAVVVVGETRAWLVRLVWAALAVVGTVVVVPQDESSAWTLARFHVTRLLGIVLMVCFAKVAMVLARMRLLADFNSRTLQGRLLKTMQHEFVLGALAGSAWNPLFLDMFAMVIAASRATGTAAQLGAKQWQDLFLYVGSHTGDGSVLTAKALRWRRPGKRRTQAQAAATATGPRAVAKRLWRRTWAVCEPHRLVRQSNRGVVTVVAEADQAREQNLQDEKEEKEGEGEGEGEAELVENGNKKGSEDKAKDEADPRGANGVNEPASRTPSPLSWSLRARSRPPKAPSSKQSGARSVVRPKIFMEDVEALFKSVDLSGDLSGDLQDLKMAGVLGELFDAGNAGCVIQHRFSQAVVGIFEDRTNISVTLLDSRRVLASIDTFAFAFALVLILFVSLALYDIDFLAVWISLSSVVIGFAFIFGKTLQVAFENAIFIFAHRPYDVGDHIAFPPAYERYVVSRINLFTTEMRRWDGHGTRFDNSRLAAMQPLLNFSTSSGRSLTPTFLVDLECCTAAFVRAVDAELRSYVAAHKQTFTDRCSFTAREILDPFKMRCVFFAHLADNITVDVFKSRRDESDFCVACAEMLQRHGARFSRAYSRPYFAPYDPPRVAHAVPQGLGVEVARPSPAPAGLQAQGAQPPNRDGPLPAHARPYPYPDEE